MLANNSTQGRHDIQEGHQPLSSVVFSGAEGCYLLTADGQRVLDLYNDSSLPLGHDHALLRESFAGSQPLNVVKYRTRERHDLLALLSRIFADYEAFQIYASGTESNEGMLRYAMEITHRSSFIGFRGACHGHTKAMASVTDMDSWHGKRIPGYMALEYPCVERDGGWRPTIEEVAQCIDEYGAGDVAGVICEPIQGKGLREPPPGWLRRLKEEVLEPRGILLLADEYLTAGRTGDWLESRNQGVLPDIISVGKCFGTGIPFAALACLRKYAPAVAKMKGEDTCGGHAPLCRNATLTIQEIERGKYLAHSRKIAGLVKEAFRDHVGSFALKRVFAKGALGGLEFDSAPAAMKVARNALRRGVLVTPIQNCLRLTPPLNIPLKDLRSGLEQLQLAIRSCALESSALPRN